MKCTFSTRDTNILMEVQPGDLFVPLGPDLVECVCAVQSIETPSAGFRIDVPQRVELDPDALRPVIVVACRVAPGEPEFYPAGARVVMPGGTPIAFVEQVEPAAFRERASQSAHVTVRNDSDELADAAVRTKNAIHFDAITGTRREVPISRL